MSVTQRLAELGLELPTVASPIGAYLPYVRSGNLVLTSGQLPFVDGALARTGKLGADLTTEEGHELARICGLNLLAIADMAVPGLAGVRVVKLTAYVASDPSFTEHPKVANGASELFAAVLGEAGRHSRSAVGVAALPQDAPVEIEAIFEVL